MRSQKSSNQKANLRVQHRFSFWKSAAMGLLALAATAAFAFQDSPALRAVSPKHAHKDAPQEQPSHASTTPDMKEYGPLMEELGHLGMKIQEGITIPAPRNQSRILRLLPASTSGFLSVPNFGEVLYQANQIFHQELDQSTVLHDWWMKNGGTAAPVVDMAVDQIHQFMGYLGDEIAISGTIKPKDGSLVIIAEVKKPGIKAYLQQLLAQYGGTNPPVQLLTPQQLLTAKPAASSQLVALVRPDFLVVASDLSALRSVNARINGGAAPFVTTPFGQRLAHAYEGGLNVLFGVDIEQLLALRPQGQPQVEAALEQTGFDNVKYLIGDGKFGGGVSSSTMELTFSGPRKGIAGWLASPTNLTGLDFISPNPIYAGAVVLQNPSLMFDQIRALAGASNPMASAGLAQFESQLGINLRQDLFSKLGGQFAFALEKVEDSEPSFTVVAQVSDPDGLQGTIKQLLEVYNEKAAVGRTASLKQKNEDGLKYSGISFFDGKKHRELAYIFADGYLVLASAPASLKQAMEMHRTGASLARSGDFLKLLPQDHPGQASAVVFQNIGLTLSSLGQTMPPEMAHLLQSLSGQNKYSLMTAYGEERSIRAVSNSQALNMAVPLMVAAVVIPNLIHSRTTANESSAAATVRMLNTAQVTYNVTYAKFAPDLASLGPGHDGDCTGNAPTASHACILDSSLGCGSGTWCAKNGFQYTTSCDKENCQDYVAVGTPTDPGKGNKSFCSTSDAVIRSKSGPPLTDPISVAECQTWSPL